MPIYWNVREIVNCILSSRLPCLFFISGFLYFYNIQKLSINKYCTKTWRRIKSLLIPYLIWNAIVVICFALVHLMMGDSINKDFYNVLEYSPIQLLRCFWNCNDGKPINVPLWFLRDLFIISLFSPFVYLLVKKGTKHLCYILLLLSFICDTPIVFFVMGAYFSIHRIDVISWIDHNRYRLLFFAIVGLSCFGIGRMCESFYLIEKIGMSSFVWSSIGLWWMLALWLVRHGYEIPQKFRDASFLVYVSHFLPTVVLCYYVLPRFVPYIGDFGCVILYLLTPLLLYYVLSLLHNWVPWLQGRLSPKK